ncbi:hypothetical protein BpHYR1_005564 [Brachionus plicatilis]|uniref:Uncharacterized protein n=1 Tax=Brachionus plicatilis TaxID=10195 RepID=A0A3M7T6S6_BRAPC|nr:hypothetical protein BpHYR1_005564 [Brachionus plicatilis]
MIKEGNCGTFDKIKGFHESLFNFNKLQIAGAALANIIRTESSLISKYDLLLYEEKYTIEEIKFQKILNRKR